MNYLAHYPVRSPKQLQSWLHIMAFFSAYWHWIFTALRRLLLHTQGVGGWFRYRGGQFSVEPLLVQQWHDPWNWTPSAEVESRGPVLLEQRKPLWGGYKAGCQVPYGLQQPREGEVGRAESGGGERSWEVGRQEAEEAGKGNSLLTHSLPVWGTGWPRPSLPGTGERTIQSKQSEEERGLEHHG